MTDNADLVVALLNNKVPMPEDQLMTQRREHGILDPERAQAAINKAQAQNRIRWVAFQGWLKGGRPV